MFRRYARALAFLVALPTIALCLPYKPVINIQTGRPDLITPLDSTTVQGGTNVTVTNNADGTVTVNSTGGGGGGSTSGTINAGAQFSPAYYSQPGSTTTLDAYSGMVLLSTGVFVSTLTVTSSATIAGATVKGNLYLPSLRNSTSFPRNYLVFENTYDNGRLGVLKSNISTTQLGLYVTPPDGGMVFVSTITAGTGFYALVTTIGDSATGDTVGFKADIGNTGNTYSNYGGYLTATGANGTNYGLYVGANSAVSGGNYAIFVDSGTVNLHPLTASLPLKLDANKDMTSAAINLSGSEVTGTMAAARMPALTGDVTTSAGNLTTSLISTLAGTKTFTSSVTVTNAVGLGAAGQAVTISSNAFIAGSTFYQGGSLAVPGNVAANSLSISSSTPSNLMVSVSSVAAVIPQDFLLSISSANGTLVEATQFNGHNVSSGTTPILSSCGTGPGLRGTDAWGTITGGATASGCTLTFNTAYSVAPTCVVTERAMSLVNSFQYTVTTTALTITQTGFGTNVVDYACKLVDAL